MLTQKWDFGNIWYYLILILVIAISIGLYHFLKRKSKEDIYKILYKLTLVNLAFHFLRLIFPPYVFEFKNAEDLRVMRVVGFENICAVNTLLGPILYKAKNKYVKDYYMFLACIGGLVALIIPVAPYTQRDLFSFDMLRYFISHYILFIIPIMALVFKLHEFNYKRFWTLPIAFFLCLSLIYFNENLTYDLGWVNEKRNFSLIYGPPENMPETFQPLADFLVSLVPDNLKNYVDQHGNFIQVTPLLWLINPFLCLVYPASFILNVALDFKHFRRDTKNLWNKAKEKFKRA